MSVEVGGRKYSRYMTPTGWSHVCHWYDTLAAAALDFNQFGQDTLEVTAAEEQNRRDEEAWYQEEQERDFHEWMAKQLTSI